MPITITARCKEIGKSILKIESGTSTCSDCPGRRAIMASVYGLGVFAIAVLAEPI